MIRIFSQVYIYGNNIIINFIYIYNCTYINVYTIYDLFTVESLVPKLLEQEIKQVNVIKPMS